MKQFTMPIIFWLMTIEDKKIREAAIENAGKYTIYGYHIEVNNKKEALQKAFSWFMSQEGFHYWVNVFVKL